MSKANIVHQSERRKVPPMSFNEAGSFIARLRRDVRYAVAGIDRATDEARCIRSEAHALKATGDAAHAEHIRELESQAERLDSHRGMLEQAIRECGYELMNAVPIIDASTTLAQRCDLLNINRADREGLSEFEGLAALIFEHGKEDSAACRHCELKDGPLFHAIYRVFHDFLATTRDGQAGGRCTFSPGGLFFDSLCNPLSARAAPITTFH
ncbi:hypothetical protein [Paraburkholderia azotifigens]|uniref:Uncharacterized protein n=1 Tax=Paraburkholderia azotifigens TaxID=2057004 RepID=A0ABU9R3I4_9BURK